MKTQKKRKEDWFNLTAMKVVQSPEDNIIEVNVIDSILLTSEISKAYLDESIILSIIMWKTIEKYKINLFSI